LIDHGFSPVVDDDSVVLVLGSMPGTFSLRATQYYGHPRNAFWPIAAAVFALDAASAYEARTDALLRHGVALWDVIASCERPGSLDADIDASSVVVNPIAALLLQQPRLRRVCCNGATSSTLFARYVAPELAALAIDVDVHHLPSTSPAHASMSFDQKCARWSRALNA
jgi:double-stranded uracil-DNA glycosylase